MKQPSLVATSALASFALLTGQVLAGPGPTTPVPTDARAPTTTKDVAVQVVIPKFDGKLVTTQLGQDVATAAGDGARYLRSATCPKLDASGNATTARYDHCLAITVGEDRDLTTYVLTDTACPSGNVAAACYGGYVIATRVDLTWSAHTADHATTTTTTVARVRLGLERGTPRKTKKATIALRGTSRFVLPTTAALTITRDTVVKTSSVSQRTQVVDASGKVLIDDTYQVIASSTGSGLSCADQGAFAQAQSEANWNLLAGLVLVGGEIAIGTAALSVAVDGSIASLGVGTPVAISAGTVIFTGGSTFAVGVALAIREYGKTQARINGLEAQEACETHERFDDLVIEDLPDIDDPDYDEPSDNPAAQNAACGGSSEGTYTDSDGNTCTESCEQSVVDGECVNACVSVC